MNPKQSNLKSIIILSCSLLGSTAIPAVKGEALLNFGPGVSVYSPEAFSWGYEFTVGEKPVEVSMLGVFDIGGANGLSLSHEVGLWDLSQNLVTSATIPAGVEGQLVGYTFQYNNAFRYMPISPVTLAPNTTYVIAAYYPINNQDEVGREVLFTPGEGVTLGIQRYQAGPSLSFPATEYPWYNGIAGPNAIISTVLVPEPAEYAIIIGGGLMAWAIWRRRSGQKASAI